MDDFLCKNHPRGITARRVPIGHTAVWRRRAVADGPPPWSVYCQHGANGSSSSNFGVMPSFPLGCSRVACCSEERASATAPVVGLSSLWVIWPKTLELLEVAFYSVCRFCAQRAV